MIGTNAAAGNYSVEIKASDTAGTSASTALRIAVTTDTPQDTPQSGTDGPNLTDRIKIKDESGTSLEARPFSGLSAGTKALYVISLEGTGITAKAWKLLINGAEVDTSSLSAGEAVFIVSKQLGENS